MESRSERYPRISPLQRHMAPVGRVRNVIIDAAAKTSSTGATTDGKET